MSNPADIFVCVIFFVLQGRLDGFPISRLSSDVLSLWSTAQPSLDSSDSLWTFPATRLLQSSYNRDRISSTPLPSLPAAAVTCRHKRIRSSDDPSPIRTPERRSYSSSDKRGTRPADITAARSSQPTPTRYNDIAAESFSRLRASSPSHETFSTTTSFAMRLHDNLRLSRREEAPVIVFDQNGKMYTNVYPPIGHRSNDRNTRKSGDGDWGRRYLPKWLVIGGNKT